MYAGVVELVDSTDLGSVTSVVCGFESPPPQLYQADVTDFSYIRFFLPESIDTGIIREYTMMI